MISTSLSDGKCSTGAIVRNRSVIIRLWRGAAHTAPTRRTALITVGGGGGGRTGRGGFRRGWEVIVGVVVVCTVLTQPPVVVMTVMCRWGCGIQGHVVHAVATHAARTKYESDHLTHLVVKECTDCSITS